MAFVSLQDLARQVSGILRPSHGGTGSTYGESRVVQHCINSTGADIELYSLVEYTFGTNARKIQKVAAADEPNVVGVLVGYYDGSGLVEADCPDGFEAAVLTAGTTPILIETTVARGEYAMAAATNGTIYSTSSAAAGAIGLVVDSADTSAGATTARVTLPATAALGGGGGATFGTPSLTLSTTNGAGSGTSAIRNNATIAAFDSTAPVTQAFSDAAATGSAGVAARRDHKHGMPASPSVPSFATPAIVLGSAAAAGAAGTVIRSDSTIQAFDASNPVTQDYGDAPATGSAAVASRRDHKHGMPSLGTSHASAAFGDHSHGTSGGSQPIYFPDAVPASPDADDDEFDDNDWTTGGVWTEFDVGAVFTPSEDENGLKISRASSNAKWGGVYRGVPSGDWSITTHCSMTNEIPASAQEFDIGILLMEGTPPGATSDFYAWAMRTPVAAFMQRGISLARWSDYQTFLSNNLGSEADGMTIASDIFLRVVRISGTYFFLWSTDGIGWTESINISSPAFTISQVGLGVWAGSSRTLQGHFRFYRKISSAVSADKYRRVDGDLLSL